MAYQPMEFNVLVAKKAQLLFKMPVNRRLDSRGANPDPLAPDQGGKETEHGRAFRRGMAARNIAQCWIS